MIKPEEIKDIATVRKSIQGRKRKLCCIRAVLAGKKNRSYLLFYKTNLKERAMILLNEISLLTSEVFEPFKMQRLQ